jgi:hypothetical protein
MAETVLSKIIQEFQEPAGLRREPAEKSSGLAQTNLSYEWEFGESTETARKLEADLERVHKG